MNAQKEKPKPAQPQAKQERFYFPKGIVGFPAFQHAELVYKKEELPFLRLSHLVKGKGAALEFLVLEPYGIYPDYKVQIAQQDLDFLEIKSPKETYLLNVVTVRPGKKGNNVIVNLVAPILINKRTMRGKQIMIMNYKQYSAEHVLYQKK